MRGSVRGWVPDWERGCVSDGGRVVGTFGGRFSARLATRCLSKRLGVRLGRRLGERLYRGVGEMFIINSQVRSPHDGLVYFDKRQSKLLSILTSQRELEQSSFN